MWTSAKPSKQFLGRGCLIDLKAWRYQMTWSRSFSSHLPDFSCVATVSRSSHYWVLATSRPFLERVVLSASWSCWAKSRLLDRAWVDSRLSSVLGFICGCFCVRLTVGCRSSSSNGCRTICRASLVWSVVSAELSSYLSWLELFSTAFQAVSQPTVARSALGLHFCFVPFLFCFLIVFPHAPKSIFRDLEKNRILPLHDFHVLIAIHSHDCV